MFLFVGDVHTSQETRLWSSTSCYGDSFTFLYVDDVRPSEETHLWTFTACYGDIFTFLYVEGVRASQETHLETCTVHYRDSFRFLFAGDYVAAVGVLQCGSIAFPLQSLAGIHDWIAQVTTAAKSWRRLAARTAGSHVS
jgi:hypothetical protein